MKRFIKSALRAFGLDLRIEARLEMAAHLRYVASLGFRPSTVIDVGAAEGTAPLFEVFPDAFHVLIEPLNEFEPQLRALVARMRGTYRIAAANDDGGPVTLNVHSDHLHGSSLLKEEMGEWADGSPRVVTGLRLDDLYQEIHFSPSVLLKIDVQGGELIVLRGATKVLQLTELILLEVSFFHFMKQSPDITEVVAYMSSVGFVPFDIFGLSYRPLDHSLAQADIAFVRRDSFLRRDHRWASDSSWLHQSQR